MKTAALLLLLLVGCAADSESALQDTYEPEAPVAEPAPAPAAYSPRKVLLDEDATWEQSELAYIAVRTINEAMGIDVYELTVVRDFTDHCDAVVLLWTKEIRDANDVVQPSGVGRYIGRNDGCDYGEIQLRIVGNDPIGRIADEGTVVHELLHGAGLQHDDEDESSVMYPTQRCFSDGSGLPLFDHTAMWGSWEQYCQRRAPTSIKPQHISYIRSQMGLK